MKVHGPSRPGPINLREVGKTERKSASGRASEAGERVQVSTHARALSQLREPETPDMSRVERLKEAIRSGNFAIDVERIASAMLQEDY